MRSAQILPFPFREKAQEQAVTRQVDAYFKRHLKNASITNLIDRAHTLQFSSNVHAEKRRQFILEELASRGIHFYEKGDMPIQDILHDLGLL